MNHQRFTIPEISLSGSNGYQQTYQVSLKVIQLSFGGHLVAL
jgi:hypothetical protein